MIRNRRKHERIPTGTPCRIRLGDAVSDALIVDHSPTGLRVAGLQLLILMVDQVVTIQVQESAINGRCRTISRSDDGTFQVGICRILEDRDEDPDSILLNSFMQFGDDKVICIPIEVVNKGQLLIKLLDQPEAVVDASEVVQLTRPERLEELCDSDKLKRMLTVYRLEPSGNEFSDRAAVLDYEFGPALKYALT